MIRRWLKPNAAGAILLALFLAAQALCGYPTAALGERAIVTDAPTSWGTSFGFPVMVSVVGGAQLSPVVVVYWPRVFVVLVGAWVVAMSLGRLMTDAGVDPARGPILRPRRRPVIVLLICLAAIPPFAFVAAIVTSKLVWGYFFSPPAVDRRVLGATQVTLVTPVAADCDAGGRMKVVGVGWELAGPWDQRLARLREMAPAPPATMPADRLEALSAALSPALQKDSRTREEVLLGRAIEFAGPDGEKLSLVSANSGPIRDDFFLHVEALIENASDGRPTRVLSLQNWYFAENWTAGFQWSQIWRALMIGLIALVVPAVSLFLIVRRLFDRFRVPRGFMIEPSLPPSGRAG